MKIKIPQVNVKKTSVKFLLICAVIFTLLDLFSKFNIFNILPIVSPIFVPFVASGFLLFEVGWSKIKSKRLDVISAFELVVACLGWISVVLYALGITSATILAIMGVVDIALLILFIVEVFKKN